MSSYMLPFGDLVNYFIDIKFHSIINIGTIGSDETPTAQLAIISHVEIQDLKDHWSTGENQVLKKQWTRPGCGVLRFIVI